MLCYYGQNNKHQQCEDGNLFISFINVRIHYVILNLVKRF